MADHDPEDPNDNLVADIVFVDGTPEILILKGESANRSYRTLGAKRLDGAWDDVTGLDLAPSEGSGYHFFKVQVVVP